MRIAVILGWLAGMALILAGEPWPLGCLGPAAGAGSVLAWRRWGRNVQALIRAIPDLLRLRKKAKEIGRAVERA